MEEIKELSKAVNKKLKDQNTKAKNLIRILICGSYHPEDKLVLQKLKKRLFEKGYPGVFLMEDIEVEGEINNAIKFNLIWGKINEGDFNPLIILYAGKNAGKSTGLNAEIQTIAQSESKRKCSYLFKLPDVKLSSFSEFLSTIKVGNDSDFLEKAEEIIGKEKNKFLHFYGVTDE